MQLGKDKSPITNPPTSWMQRMDISSSCNPELVNRVSQHSPFPEDIVFSVEFSTHIHLQIDQTRLLILSRAREAVVTSFRCPVLAALCKWQKYSQNWTWCFCQQQHIYITLDACHSCHNVISCCNFVAMLMLVTETADNRKFMPLFFFLFFFCQTSPSWIVFTYQHSQTLVLLWRSRIDCERPPHFTGKIPRLRIKPLRPNLRCHHWSVVSIHARHVW